MHMEKLSGKKIAKNMMLSVLAQAVSVLVKPLGRTIGGVVAEVDAAV